MSTAPTPEPVVTHPSWLSQVGSGILNTSLKTAGFVVILVAACGGLLSWGGYELAHQRPHEEPPPAVDPTPAPPSVTPPINPAPPLVEIPKIEIHGPQPHLIITEVATLFAVNVKGGGEPQWHIVPPNAASVNPTHGHMIDVTAHDQGKFSLFVSVAGDHRQLATAQVEVEAIAQVIQHPTPTPPQPDVPPPAPAPATRSVADVIMAQLAQVNSPNRAAEAHTIAGCINTVIGRINAGFISPNADVANEIEDAVQNALGAKAANWDLLLGSISIVIDTFRAQGQITTAATTVPALSEIAGVLLKAQ